jgi:hypothetical protein
MLDTFAREPVESPEYYDHFIRSDLLDGEDYVAIPSELWELIKA